VVVSRTGALQASETMTSPDLDFLFLGTGTSSTVPAIHCLTDPATGCLCCRSTMRPGGERNKRRNTAAIVRVTQPDDQPPKCVARVAVCAYSADDAPRTILIDCGKSFYAAATEWFPKHGLRQLDAVLLTHPHAV
jgi:phosphoribosyl 1,2-cyclic phosphodiesterase